VLKLHVFLILLACGGVGCCHIGVHRKSFYFNFSIGEFLWSCITPSFSCHILAHFVLDDTHTNARVYHHSIRDRVLNPRD